MSDHQSVPNWTVDEPNWTNCGGPLVTNWTLNNINGAHWFKPSRILSPKEYVEVEVHITARNAAIQCTPTLYHLCYKSHVIGGEWQKLSEHTVLGHMVAGVVVSHWFIGTAAITPAFNFRNCKRHGRTTSMKTSPSNINLYFRRNNADRQFRQVDQKSNQWFGATLTSTGRNGAIMINLGTSWLRHTGSWRDMRVRSKQLNID
uniref:SFRICE_007774 n=1 Tax=Spodoptera frugiperda TaxID=7108 RepID=A0A2H1WC76_SPOFR